MLYRWQVWALFLTIHIATVHAQDVSGENSFSKGLDSLERGEWATAVSNFTAALEQDEDNPEFYLARGVARTLAEKFPEAQKDLNRVLRLKQDDFEAKLWLAASFFMDNDAEKGSLNLSYGRQETHQYTELVYNMSRAYMESRYQRAYFDMETKQRTQTNEPIRKDFKKAAAVFVERHRGGKSAAKVTETTAVDALHQGRYAEALAGIEKLRQVHPDDIQLLTLHAEASLGVQDALTAREEYTALLTGDPFVAEYYLNRARAAAMLGDIPRAKSDWEQVRKLNAALEKGSSVTEITAVVGRQVPAVQEILVLRDQLLKKAGSDVPYLELVQLAKKLDQAVNCHRLRANETYQDNLRQLLAATKMIPPTADSLANLGGFLYQQATQIRGESVEPRAPHQTYRPASKESLAEEMKRSEDALDAAIKIQPEHVKALTYKAGCLMWRLRWDEAESVVKKALGLQPKSPELLDLCSQFMDHAASVKAAKAASLREVQTWSDLSYTYWRRPSQAELDQADVYDQQAAELWKVSSQSLDAAAKAASGTALGFYYDGVIARGKKDATAAVTAFEKAVQMDPSLIQAHDQLSAMYSALGTVDKAHEHQSAANNLIQTTAGPMLRLAWLQIARTARKAAREASQRAWSLDPADPRALAYLGVIERDAEKYEEAAGYLRAALALVEARARMHGQTLIAEGTGRINDADLGLGLAIQLQLSLVYGAAEKTDQAKQVCESIVALQSRVAPEQIQRNLTTAMLPDPAADQLKVPEAEPVAVFFAQAHVQLGQAALAAGELDSAESNFRAAQKLEASWPFTLPGRERFFVSSCWARLGTIKVMLARGQAVEADQMMNREGWPGGLPDALRDEIAKLREQLNKRRSE